MSVVAGSDYVALAVWLSVVAGSHYVALTILELTLYTHSEVGLRLTEI